MKTPNFSAESSLYKADHFRQIAESRIQEINGHVVVPQYSLLNVSARVVCWWVVEWLGYGYYRLYRQCASDF
jgi:hypothetical protein